MKIYAIFVTLVSVILILAVFKWKIATIAITYFCKENFSQQYQRKQCRETLQ
jgi:hypothetical protein